MAGLCWMAVVLAVFLSAGNSLAAVDQNWLKSIIEGIRNQYALGDTFSLAVNVPQNQDPDNLQQVFQDDPVDIVKQTVSEGQVYQGTRLVAAGAVEQVLEKIQPFIKSSQGNFLVIYSEESPCGPTCTNANEDSITSKINDVIQNWSDYAFVFSKVVDVPGADTPQLSESFKKLGISKLGLDNIFRCYQPGDDPFQCTSCSSGGDVTPSCVSNNAPSIQEAGVADEISTVPPTGTDLSKEESDASIGKEISKDMGEETAGRIGKRKGERKGSEVRKQCKRKGGCKRRGGGKRRKGGKVKQCKRKGGCKRRGGGKRRKGGKVKKGGKQRKGGKGRGRGKTQGWRRGKGKRRGKKHGRRRGRGWWILLQ